MKRLRIGVAIAAVVAVASTLLTPTNASAVSDGWRVGREPSGSAAGVYKGVGKMCMSAYGINVMRPQGRKRNPPAPLRYLLTVGLVQTPGTRSNSTDSVVDVGALVINNQRSNQGKTIAKRHRQAGARLYAESVSVKSLTRMDATPVTSSSSANKNTANSGYSMASVGNIDVSLGGLDVTAKFRIVEPRLELEMHAQIKMVSGGLFTCSVDKPSPAHRY